MERIPEPYELADQYDNELADKLERLHRLRKRNNMNESLFELGFNEELAEKENLYE